MHMADALLSPAVAGSFWVVIGAATVYSAKKIDSKSSVAAFMGVMGAFIFAVQMLNFSIPLTGSSGHLGGGLLLSILLGSFPAFIVMLSVLTIQALFFADGGVLALGANIFNIAFIPAFIVYPLIYKRLEKNQFLATIVSALACLELGAFAVVIETYISGITELSFLQFMSFMLPIHLAIGLVEGLATYFVVIFIQKASPNYIHNSVSKNKPIFAALMLMAFVASGFFALYASEHPDGLEWSIINVAGEELAEKETIFNKFQEKVAIFPGYENNSGIIGVIISAILISATAFVILRRTKRE